MHPDCFTFRPRRWLPLLPVLSLVGLLAIASPSLTAGPKKPSPPEPKGTEPAGPKTSLISAEEWLSAPTGPIQPGDIDRLIEKELRAGKIRPAALTTDAQFLRRVMLDLTGELPMPADVTEFVADRDKNKRAKLIDKLLASEEFARHWARYWREVIGSRLSELRGQLFARNFEEWMAEQLQKNTSWSSIARQMILANGPARFTEPDKGGPNFFLASRFGADANVERAAETSRVFMGIQIQCAQCHDHPSDVWKRQQFHEFAAYFARVQQRPMREENRLVGYRLFSRPLGEHRMPSKTNPRQGTAMVPRFLNGESPGRGLTDMQRRKALADSIVSKKNYWFAGAYVNRVWGELLGQSFVNPVDDMGPQKDALFPGVLTRLAGSFRGSDYDMKALFRAILNSRTYQRQIRLGESSDDHLMFAASYPTRLKADALWQSLVNVLGKMGAPAPAARRRGPYALFQGFEGLFKNEFRFDPSLKADEVEGSIPQALLLMNSPVINNRIQARGTNLLARILKSYPKNDDALRMVYLRTLARKPTDRELAKCRKYLQKVGNRAEAFEDILWALINSTEFQTKR
jgi:hypothetical protein